MKKIPTPLSFPHPIYLVLARKFENREIDHAYKSWNEIYALIASLTEFC